MADFAGRKTLVVERFDRLVDADGRLLRLPVEDCCQLCPFAQPQIRIRRWPGYPRHCRAVEGGATRRQRSAHPVQSATRVLAARRDRRARQKLQHPPGIARGRFSLAPLYDIMWHNPIWMQSRSEKNQMKLAMAVGKRRPLCHRLDCDAAFRADGRSVRLPFGGTGGHHPRIARHGAGRHRCDGAATAGSLPAIPRQFDYRRYQSSARIAASHCCRPEGQRLSAQSKTQGVRSMMDWKPANRPAAEAQESVQRANHFFGCERPLILLVNRSVRRSAGKRGKSPGEAPL